MPEPLPMSGAGQTHVTRVDVLVFYLQRATAETRFSLDDFSEALALSLIHI